MPSEGRQSWHYDTPIVSASDDRTKALISDYGPWGKGNAPASAGAAGPFYEQRTPPMTQPGPQYLQGTTGRTDLPDGYAGVHLARPRDLPGAGRPPPTDARDFGPSFYKSIDRQGSGQAAK